MRRPARFLLVLPGLLLLLSGCVSKDEFLRKSDEADTCQKSLSAKVKESQELAKELSAAQTGLSGARRRVDELTGQVQALTRDRDDLKAQLATSQAVNEELKGQNDKLDGLLKSKDVSQAQVIQETMDLNRKLRDQNTDLREQLARKDGELRSAQERLAQASAERDSVNVRLAELQQRIDDLNKQKDEDLARLKSTYDELVGSLKGEIEAGQVQITRMKDRLSVNLVEKILFDSGKAEIKPAGLEVLAKVGEQLAKVKNKRIQIEGHTDNVPINTTRFPSNWELSSARAMAVVHFLQDKVKIDTTLLSAAGYGEYQPAQGNESPEGRAANRRIEIVLLPLYERASEAQEKTAAPPAPGAQP